MNRTKCKYCGIEILSLSLNSVCKKCFMNDMRPRNQIDGTQFTVKDTLSKTYPPGPVQVSGINIVKRIVNLE